MRTRTANSVTFLLPTPIAQGSAFTGSQFASSKHTTACGIWGPPTCSSPLLLKVEYGTATFNLKTHTPVNRTVTSKCSVSINGGTGTASSNMQIRIYNGDPPPKPT